MRKVCFVIVLVWMWLAIPVLAQDDSDLCFDKGGITDDETGQCKIHALLEINADYPLEYADSAFIAEQVDSYIDGEIQNFMTMFVDNGIVPSHTGWGLTMTYSEVRYSDTIFTVVFDDYQFTGGAHGMTVTHAMTFDTETETILTLDDVFTDVDDGLATVVPFAVEQVTEALGEMADEDWILDGTSPDVDTNYATWALSDEGVVFYFGQYQVAPYAAGIQTVTIPFADLSGVLEPAFVPHT